ncbi:MAG TPA: elongation factor P [Candidatus Paceibacterota bacterium]|nr:elongation factor P [Candidatus Paceibacterota bacterium]
MATLDYNEITQRKYILHDGEPYEVLTSWVFRKQKRKPVNQTKLRNLISGRTIEVTFHASDRAVEADMGTTEVKYLYSNRGEYWFCPPNDPGKRFKLSEEIAGDALKWIKENQIIEARTFNDEIIGIRPPIKAELKVTEAAPAVKGDTSSGAMKTVTVETGATLNVPLFINEGDILRINTETGEYVERAEKA